MLRQAGAPRGNNARSAAATVPCTTGCASGCCRSDDGRVKPRLARYCNGAGPGPDSGPDPVTRRS